MVKWTPSFGQFGSDFKVEFIIAIMLPLVTNLFQIDADSESERAKTGQQSGQPDRRQPNSIEVRIGATIGLKERWSFRKPLFARARFEQNSL